MKYSANNFKYSKSRNIKLKPTKREKKEDDSKKKISKKQRKEKDESDDEYNLDEDEDMDLFGNEVTIEGNHIYFNSDVTKKSIFDLCQALNNVALDNIVTATQFNIEPIPIYLHINSNGGSVFAAFTAIDNIMNCKVPVYTIIEGASASAATIMSVVGKKRYIRPNSYMLIHELRSGCWGRMSEMEDEMENNKKLMKRIKKIYKEHTTIPHEEMKEILKHDMWWDSEKCLEMGLVDSLWE